MRTDGSHMHVHNNQAAERGVSQPVQAKKRARGRKKKRVGRHVRPDGSHMHVHNNQAANRGVVSRREQTSEREACIRGG